MTPPTVAPPPFRSSDTPTTRYGFFARPTVWLHVTAIGFAVDAVAVAAFEAASKTTCANAGAAHTKGARMSRPERRTLIWKRGHQDTRPRRPRRPYLRLQAHSADVIPSVARD